MIGLLCPRPGSAILDGTVGLGGHAEAILEANGPDGRVFGFDRDTDALERARGRLERFGQRVVLTADDFANAARRLATIGVTFVDGALLDLGVSSLQLDTAERGFSFRQDGPLDMRMSCASGRTAADLLASLSVTELERILREWGEEPQARAIARKIVEVRKRTRITRTGEFAELVRSVVRGGGGIHPATRSFQALRIAVNNELESLSAALPDIVAILGNGARLVVISFHSLEDRIVKQTFRDLEERGFGRVTGHAPLVTGEDERRANPRSRSAKVRAFERVA